MALELEDAMVSVFGEVAASAHPPGGDGCADRSGAPCPSTPGRCHSLGAHPCHLPRRWRLLARIQGRPPLSGTGDEARLPLRLGEALAGPSSSHRARHLELRDE